MPVQLGVAAAVNINKIRQKDNRDSCLMSVDGCRWPLAWSKINLTGECAEFITPEIQKQSLCFYYCYLTFTLLIA